MKITAIIAAGGNSSRMKGRNKLLEDVGGRAVLVRSAEAFLNVEAVDSVIIVAAEEFVEEYRKLLTDAGVLDGVRFITGGRTRRESVYFGLMEADRETGIVVIHDAARPLVTERLITDCIEAAAMYGACCAAVPLTDTVKESDRAGFVRMTLDRSSLYRIQTPQAFIYKDILKLHKKAAFRGLSVTDDAQVAEYFGYKVYLVDSDESNIKITTETDFIIAEALLAGRDDAGAVDSLAPAEHSEFLTGGGGETDAADVDGQ